MNHMFTGLILETFVTEHRPSGILGPTATLRTFYHIELFFILNAFAVLLSHKDILNE